MEDNTAVVYFSAQGHTKQKAKEITKKTGGTLYEITPIVPYSKEDLNWHLDNSRTSVEAKDKNCRPGIKDIAEFPLHSPPSPLHPILKYFSTVFLSEIS